MPRSKKEKMIVFGIAGALAIVTLLFGRKANAAESGGAGFAENVPGGSAGANTFSSLLANSLSSAVDQSVTDITPGDNNSGPRDVAPQVGPTVGASPPQQPTSGPPSSGGGIGGSRGPIRAQIRR